MLPMVLLREPSTAFRLFDLLLRQSLSQSLNLLGLQLECRILPLQSLIQFPLHLLQARLLPGTEMFTKLVLNGRVHFEHKIVNKTTCRSTQQRQSGHLEKLFAIAS